MTHDPNTTDDKPQPLTDDDLVAYLDGELSAEACNEIERRLSEDAHLRRRLQAHQAAWELLDEVPRAEIPTSFTQTTVEMVAVTAAEDSRQAARHALQLRRLAWTAAAAAWVATALAAYGLTSFVVSRPNRELVQDLPIIEHLDAYENAGDIAFLKRLASEGLFTAEVDDDDVYY